MKIINKGQVHRFGDHVAVSLGNSETLYMTPQQAALVAQAINGCVSDIHKREFPQSEFRTVKIY